MLPAVKVVTLYWMDWWTRVATLWLYYQQIQLFCLISLSVSTLSKSYQAIWISFLKRRKLFKNLWVFLTTFDSKLTLIFYSAQFSSVTQSCPTLCNPVNHSTPGLPVHHLLLESTQIYVHCVGDVIQPSHPLLSPSPPALNLSQHQGLFKWVRSSHQVAKVLEFQLPHQSNELISFRMD